jgi:putative endonuclease
MYFTYVLRSGVDRNLYIGFCKDLKVRLAEHNKGKVKSTKFRAPFDLVYYEACLDKNKAIKREKYFKTGFGRRYLKSRI